MPKSWSFPKTLREKAKWSAGFLVAAVTLTLVTFLGAKSASAGGYDALRSRANGLCLDVQSWRTDAGAPIQQWGCHYGGNQTWYAISVAGTDTFVFKNQHSGKCLDNGGTNWAGAKTIQWHCHYGPEQQWKLRNVKIYNGITSGELLNARSGLCLDVPSASGQYGLRMQQWYCNNHVAQQWYRW